MSPPTTQQELSNPPHSLGRQYWFIVGAAIILVAGLFQELFLMWVPYRELAEFMDTTMILQMQIDALALYHAGLIAALLGLIGGILLLFRLRLGFVLGIASAVYLLAWAFEGMVIAIYPMLTADATSRSMAMEMAIELLAITYYLPVFMVLGRALILWLLYRRTTRQYLQVSRSHVRWALGLALLLFAEANLILLLQWTNG